MSHGVLFNCSLDCAGNLFHIEASCVVGYEIYFTKERAGWALDFMLLLMGAIK
jgi:hypothetical protein